MLCISLGLHAFVLFGAAQKNARTAAAVSHNRKTSSVKIIKTKIAQPKTEPKKPVEKKAVEKLQEPPPEVLHEEESEMEESGGEGDITEREYNELLAYIKKFIDRNLVYPPIARQRNVEGAAGVSFVIDSSGEIGSISINNSSGSSILDNAAVSLIKKMGRIKNISIKNKLALNINVDYKLTE